MEGQQQMHPVKKYTVCVLLNRDGSKVLLQKKDRTSFKGKLNGVGGKFEEEEAPMECAYREIEEETSLKPDDITMMTWLGMLVIPEQCDTQNMDCYPELHFFSGIVDDETKAVQPEAATEPIRWYPIALDGKPVTDIPLAGDGDLEYFIRMAQRFLFNK